ncbi:MAG: DUF1624 domain-containing protein [Cytophagaceae bacterium]
MEIQQHSRVSSIDILRGIIMLLMALDHTRDFFHADAFIYNAEDLSRTTPPLFLTRWITHFCAPLFALLAGISAFLFGTKSQSRKDLAFFLLSRGLILILLELTVIRFAWRFYIDYSNVSGLVIWALGWSMVFMSGLVFLPRYLFLGLSLIIIFFHNLLDSLAVPDNKFMEFILAFFHQNRFVKLGDEFGVNILYPVLPMIGIMMLGYSIGYWYKRDYNPAARKKNLLLAGSAFIVLFIALRFSNFYGDPSPWTGQKNGMFTFLSFLNCTKYPMSLLYLLMTAGPGLIVLSWLEGKDWRVLNPLRIIGRVPLFYYIVHLFLIHALAIAFAVITHYDKIGDILQGKWNKLAENYGYHLTGVYLVWMLVVVILYFICLKYERFQKTSKMKWLKFI